jgi:hypothetical protein
MMDIIIKVTVMVCLARIELNLHEASKIVDAFQAFVTWAVEFIESKIYGRCHAGLHGCIQGPEIWRKGEQIILAVLGLPKKVHEAHPSV